jgi:two-component system response regulator HydG
VGKHAVAEAMHQMSPVARGPFVRLTAGDRSDVDVEAALLGAVGGRRGLLATATGGTLFVEGLDALSTRAQESLLQVARPSGARVKPSGGPACRLIVATTHELADVVRSGALNGDLYALLASLPIRVPSLRTRGDAAVRTLAERILTRMRLRYAKGPQRCSVEALGTLHEYEWPGNVAQLRRVLEDAFLLSLDDEVLGAAAIATALARSGGRTPTTNVEEFSLAHAERRQIARVLARSGGNRSEAARLLGITRTTLYKKMDEYGLSRPERD